MGVASSFGIHTIVFISSIVLICLYEFVPIYTYTCLFFNIQSKCLIQNSLCKSLKNISTYFYVLSNKQLIIFIFLQNCKVFFKYFAKIIFDAN